MKPIQIMFDERLLKRLDADEEVQKFGRSAVLRRAAESYLRRARALRIARQYRRAYSGRKKLDPDLEGWENAGVWPEE
jgi:metal-responsive CopG/Arc/MetJ family transcriptional regulator